MTGGEGSAAANGGGAAGAGGGKSTDGGGGGSGDGSASMHSSGPLAFDPDGMGHYTRHLLQGAGSGASSADRAHPDFPTRSDSATDFSLDSTGLPRYGNNSRVMSAMAMRTDITGDTATTAAMQTSDSFDKVASWYHDQLPADWKETRTDDMQKMTKQLSMANVGKMLHSYATGTAADADTAASADSSGAPAGPSVGIWTAPDNDNRHYRSVMVTTKPGKPTMIVMSRAVQP